MFETKYPLIKYVTGKSNDNACFSSTFSCHVSKITPKLLNDTVGVPKKPQNTWPQGLLFSWNTLRTSSRISFSVHHYSFWLLNFCAILNGRKIMVPSVSRRKYCLYEKATGTVAPLYWIRNPVSTKVTKFLWMPIWRIANTFLLKESKFDCAIFYFVSSLRAPRCKL